jgi:hypothetical protein
MARRECGGRVSTMTGCAARSILSRHRTNALLVSAALPLLTMTTTTTTTEVNDDDDYDECDAVPLRIGVIELRRSTRHISNALLLCHNHKISLDGLDSPFQDITRKNNATPWGHALLETGMISPHLACGVPWTASKRHGNIPASNLSLSKQHWPAEER